MTKEKELKLTIKQDFTMTERKKAPSGGDGKLTPKQEAFAQAYIETGNASEAYRRAYDAARMKPEVIAVKASELMANGKVAVRVQALRDQALKRHEVTVDSLIRELEEARVLASTGERPQASAMVTASMGKAKILGFIVEKNEHTGKGGGPIQTQEVRDMSDEELDAELSRYGIKS